MTGHTPGPWNIVPEAEAQSRFIVGDREGGSIADCQPPGPWMSSAEADANARLIAAAPDMLAALKDCLQFETMIDVGKIRAAIAKAEGNTR